MVIGEITSSQQDIMFVHVRVEDAAFMETHNCTVKANYYISNSIGQKFSTARWVGRIKIKDRKRQRIQQAEVIAMGFANKDKALF